MKYLLCKYEIFAEANMGKFHFVSHGAEGDMIYFTIPARKLFHIRRKPNISLFSSSQSQNRGHTPSRLCLDNPQKSDIVVKRGDSEPAVISAIKNKHDLWYGENHQECPVITLNFSTRAAKDAIEYVKPFENGVFSQTYNMEGKWFPGVILTAVRPKKQYG